MAKSEGDRCVLTLPLLTEPWQEHILEKRFRIMEHLKNSLIAMELRKLKNVQRTKAYRELEKQIWETPKEKRKSLYSRRTKMLKEARFTEYDFIDDMTNMQKHFVEHIAAQISHKAASDVWRSFEKYLFDDGREVHFHRRGTLDSVANKKLNNGMSYRDGVFTWSGGQCPNKIKLSVKVQNPSNEYEEKMLRNEIKYLRVVRKWMKTRYKYYLQFTLVGKPAVKKNHRVSSGRVGIDIGTQSVAICSGKAVHLLELADRVDRNHEKLLLLQRKMDASRRAVNPENYNPNGTIRHGVKLRWKQSNRYRLLQAKARELQRRNADIRKYQHNCLANYVLTLGNEIYVEPMDYRALQHRAKQTTVNAAGRFNRKKRFGKSLANKAPSMFLSILEKKVGLLETGSWNKVDKWEYRASQYDHLSGEYRHKKLSQRHQKLENGDRLQRDLYSAFLLMNADASLVHPDRDLCDRTYPQFKELHDLEIERIRTQSTQRLSSFGIA